MRMRSGALAALLCVALLAGCDKPEVPATTAVSERPPAASSSPGASSDIETIMGLPVPSLDLNTKEGIREYLVGEWWYDTGCIDDFLCHMVIDEELGVSLSFINYGTDEDRGTYEGQISLDWIFVEEPKAPDLICIDLGEYETQYPGGDYCFTHQTIYEGKRAMSWYFMGNGDSVFGLLDEDGFGFPPTEILFTKHTGEESGLKPRPNAEFYATFWGYSGFDDNAIWLDDLTQKEPDYTPLYPWEMAHFENKTKESVAYTLQPGVLVGIEEYLLIRGNVYLVRTDAYGEIYYMADADYDALSGEYDDTVPEWLKEHLCTILSEVVEVQEYLDMGMSLLVTDDEELINGKWCNIVRLGTDHGEHFVSEFTYAVYADFSQNEIEIYHYDPFSDSWEVVAMG